MMAFESPNQEQDIFGLWGAVKEFPRGMGSELALGSGLAVVTHLLGDLGWGLRLQGQCVGSLDRAVAEGGKEG